MQYRYETYEKTCFDSYLPDGTHWEMIESEATTEVFSAGLIFNFGAGL